MAAKTSADKNAQALDRTGFAIERTFAAWMRFGSSCVGIGLGLRVQFADTDHPFLARLVALAFVFIGLIVFWMTLRRSLRAVEKTSSGSDQSQKKRKIVVTAVSLSLAAIVIGVLLWFW